MVAVAVAVAAGVRGAGHRTSVRGQGWQRKTSVCGRVQRVADTAADEGRSCGGRPGVVVAEGAGKGSGRWVRLC